MKTLLYMAISADGNIADSKGKVPWSGHEWEKFIRQVRACGNLVIGRKTCEIMQKHDGFSNFESPCVVVVSRTLKSMPQGNFQIAETPAQALELIAAKNFATALVAGGAKLNGGFLEQGLVDEMILDVEPCLLPGGIPLFRGNPLQQKLELIGTEPYGGGIALHYRVLR